MGQTVSKRISSTSTASSRAPLTRDSNVSVSSALPQRSLSHATQPQRPQPIHRMSELIDPRSLISSDDPTTPPRHPSISNVHPSPDTNSPCSPTPGLVQSPSGNLLSTDEFLNHPDRPLAMWERRERVLSATREAVERYEMESRAGVRGKDKGIQKLGGKNWWNCCGCCRRRQ